MIKVGVLVCQNVLFTLKIMCYNFSMWPSGFEPYTFARSTQTVTLITAPQKTTIKEDPLLNTFRIFKICWNGLPRFLDLVSCSHAAGDGHNFHPSLVFRNEEFPPPLGPLPTRNPTPSWSVGIAASLASIRSQRSYRQIRIARRGGRAGSVVVLLKGWAKTCAAKRNGYSDCSGRARFAEWEEYAKEILGHWLFFRRDWKVGMRPAGPCGGGGCEDERSYGSWEPRRQGLRAANKQIAN